MPWWFWILLWIALVALALLLHLTLGYRLFRKFMATVHDLGDAGKRFSNLSPAAETSDVEVAGRTRSEADADGHRKSDFTK